MSQWTIERLDLDGDEARLRAAHAVELAVDKETLSDEDRPFEEWISFRHQPTWVRMRPWVAVADDGNVIGFGRVELTDVDNVHMGWGWFGVLREHRRRGVGSDLLRAIAQEVADDGRTLLSMGFNKDNGGELFLTRFGMEERLVGAHNRTYVAEIDKEMVRSWVDQRMQRAGEYELRVWEGPTPSDLTDRFAAARAIMNTVPIDDMDFEDETVTPEMQLEIDEVWRARGFEWITVAAIAPDGEIAGYTQMYFSKWRPDQAHQEDTGVDPAHRNRGIGRWLKAAMLLHVIEERPSVAKIDTGNAASNAPMLSINQALGFRPVERWAVWQAPVELVLKELAAAAKV